jgi:hypothetical protein
VAPATTVASSSATGKEIASKKSAVYHLNNDCVDAKPIKPENRVTGKDAKIGRHLHTGCPRRQD